MSEQQFFERVVVKPLAFGQVSHPIEKVRDDIIPIANHYLQDPDVDSSVTKQEKVKPWDDKRPLFMCLDHQH